MFGKKKIDLWEIWKGWISYNYEVVVKKSGNIWVNVVILFLEKWIESLLCY